MKIRHFLLLSATAFSLGIAHAQSLDPDAASALARQFFSTSRANGPHRVSGTVTPLLAYTAVTEGTPDFYVFNRGEGVPGFVIINADASSEASILGYVDTASFDYASAPDALRWWLEQYRHNGVAKVPAQVTASRQSVSPLISTKWDQQAPFNDLVPSLPGYTFVTGCTATAMAQIMNYYRYPERGVGSKNYTVNYIGKGTVNYSANFGETTYDWGNMLDDYSHGYTAQQGNAVATLMYHAGVAEKTIYNNAASSADDRHSGMALIEHFDYDPSMLRAERRYVSDTDWEEIVYTELAAGRPLIYSGQTKQDLNNSEGHSFICDGYNASDNTFHMNWGWSGNWDGYFRLTGSDALRPDGTGTGGGAAGSSYVYHQTLNYNIRRNHGGAAALHVALLEGGQLSETSSSPALTSYTFDRTASEEIFLHYSMSPYNFGFDAAAFEYGVMFRNTDNGHVYVSKIGDTNNLKDGTLGPGSYYIDENEEPLVYDHAFPTSLLAEAGHYEVLPAFRSMGQDWQVSAYDISLTIPTITVIGDYVAPEEPLVPDLTDGICFYDYPTMGNKNLADASHLVLTMPVANNSAADKAISFYGVAYLNVPVNIPVNDEVYSAGTRVNYTSDFSSLKSYMTPGKTYIINFYTDSSRSTTMNVPSITFYYDGNSVITVSDVTAIIKKAQEGNAPLKLIKAAVEKTLGK